MFSILKTRIVRKESTLVTDCTVFRALFDTFGCLGHELELEIRASRGSASI
jgi:hypothetical protein